MCAHPSPPGRAGAAWLPALRQAARQSCPQSRPRSERRARSNAGCKEGDCSIPSCTSLMLGCWAANSRRAWKQSDGAREEVRSHQRHGQVSHPCSQVTPAGAGTGWLCFCWARCAGLFPADGARWHPRRWQEKGCCGAQALPPILGVPSMEKGLAGHWHGQEQALRTWVPCPPLQPHPTRPSQAMPEARGWGVMRPRRSTPAPTAGPPSQGQIWQRAGRAAGTTNSLRPPGLGPSPCPAPALTFPLGPLGSWQVAKMCWGGRGLAASCRTSSSPLPRLDPVTRTLRASAAISAASAPGGDTRQDCCLLGMKRSRAQPRVWLQAPTGMGTLPAPALAPRLPQAEPGSQGGPRAPHHFATWGRMSPALPSTPPLHSSKAPAPRVPVTTGEGSPLPRAWKSTWKHHQEGKTGPNLAVASDLPVWGVSLGWSNPGMLIQSPAWEVQGGHV